jgi:hypothetical protein
LPQLTWPAWLPTRRLGHWSATVGQSDPSAKYRCNLFLKPGILENKPNLVKLIEYYLFIRKLCMTYQNAQKNELYLFVSIFMHYKQL